MTNDRKGKTMSIPVCNKGGKVLYHIFGGRGGRGVRTARRLERDGHDDRHAAGHGNPGTWKGTPRKGKNGHQFVGPVRIK
jgi:hypothetical protein